MYGTTSRERVLASLHHREPGRIPIDLSGHRSSGISAIAYPKLRAALGLPPRTVDVYDPVQQLAIVHDDVLDRLGIDTIELGRAFCLDDRWWSPWTLPDGTPCRMPVWAQPEESPSGWLLRSPSGRIMARMPEALPSTSIRSTGPSSTAKRISPASKHSSLSTCGPP